MNETEDAATIKYVPSVLNSLLADMERLAWVTKNPLFIWNGISLCVEQNLPIPEYALDYIKAVATALAPFTRETILKNQKNKVKPEEISKRVLDALQITTGAGCPNAFENMRRDQRKGVANHHLDCCDVAPEGDNRCARAYRQAGLDAAI
jgi:hypothetical protein